MTTAKQQMNWFYQSQHDFAEFALKFMEMAKAGLITREELQRRCDEEGGYWRIVMSWMDKLPSEKDNA